MASENYLRVVNPYDNELVKEIKKTKEVDVIRCIHNAVLGQQEWSAKLLNDRAKILYKFVELVKLNKSALGSLLSQESGKPISEAIKEINNIIIGFLAFIEKAKHLNNLSFPGESEAGQQANIQISAREPLGVIACILPFNFPCDLFCQKVAPALMMGNAVIVLPSIETPLAVRELVGLLKQAGVPQSVIQVVIGHGEELGPILTRHPDIKMVSFTGSTRVGLKVAKSCSDRLAQVSLELGGNDAFIVCEDADTDLAVKEMIQGRMYNTGQVCSASKRFIIHSSQIQRFVDKSVEQLDKLRYGSPQDQLTNIGCLISQEAAREVERQVKLTLSQGGKLVYGGRRFGSRYTPTIITNIPSTADVASDMEILGPIVAIIPFDNEEDAINIANSSIYALSASVFTEDYKKAISYSKRIESGVFVVNGASLHRSFEIPFCGHKMSGFGTSGVSSSLQGMSKLKMLILKDVYEVD